MDNFCVSFKKQLMSALGFNEWSQEDVVDYLYAVAHHRKFIKSFEVFFSFGIPKFPIPKERRKWLSLTQMGRALRKLHLLEFEMDSQDSICLRNAQGELLYQSDEIEFIVIKEASKCIQVWINHDQYFDGVSQVAWTFFIGGYQPAQQWLKDRKKTKRNRGRSLSEQEVIHYCKIIKALNQTHQLMNDIEAIDFLS